MKSQAEKKDGSFPGLMIGSSGKKKRVTWNLLIEEFYLKVTCLPRKKKSIS